MRFFWLFDPRRKGIAGASDLSLSNPRPFLAEPRQRAVIFAESRATPTVQKKEELGKRQMKKRSCMNAVHAETPQQIFPLSSTSIIQRDGFSVSFVKVPVRCPPSTSTSPTCRFYTCVLRLSKANIPKRSSPGTLGTLGTLSKRMVH